MKWFLLIIILIAKTVEEMEEQEYKRRKALMSTTSIQSRSAENSQGQGKLFQNMHLSIRKLNITIGSKCPQEPFIFS